MTELDDLEDRHQKALAKVAAGRALEKDGRRFRKQGDVYAAMTAYDKAREFYSDSDLAYHEQGESELARSVVKAMRRCSSIVSNLHHPQKRRPAATTPRPICLTCEKPLRRFKYDGKTFSDGTPREWGDYGDNRFCGLRCGWTWACRNTRASRSK